MKSLLLFSLLFCTITLLYAQPGTLDTSFGKNGSVSPTGRGTHNAILQQPDGKLLTAGGYIDQKLNSLGIVARLLLDGTADSSFGTNGYANYPPLGGATDMVLTQGNKIVIVGALANKDGHSEPAVARFMPDGMFDSSFGINGITIIPVFGDISGYFKIRVQTDGSLIVAGSGQTDPEAVISEYGLLIHLSANGIFDTSFGNQGRVLNYTNLFGNIYQGGLAIQKDGKILMAGYDFFYSNYVLSRYNPNGTPDNSFGNEGTVVTNGLDGYADISCGVVVQPDGKIVVGGYSSSGDVFMAALRYNTNGTLDNTFGNAGKAFVSFDNRTPVAYAILLQPDGKIVLAGRAYNNAELESDFALCRLNANGSIDSSFANNGRQVTLYSKGDIAYCAALQQDGKIVLGGFDKNGRSLLTRYNGDKQQNQLIVRIKRILHNHGIGWQGLDSKSIMYYSVQYSKTGSGFIEKGKVSGAGSSNFQQYNFNIGDAGYYRVVAIDRKGYKTFSNKVLVTEADNTASLVSIYPNPANNYITIKGLATNTTANISITDGSGNIKARGINNGSTQYRFQLTNMQPGTYYINITTATKTETLKFVKE